MRLHRMSAVVPLALSLWAGGALAAEVTGQQLLSLCTASASAAGGQLDAAECFGYVAGVAESFDCNDDSHGFTWNSQAPVSQKQLVVTVVAWLGKHPDAIPQEGRRVVWTALQDAFPCEPAANSD